jgi:hypothetical protein
MMRIRSQLKIARKLVDPEIPLGLFRPMTTDAISVQESVKRLGGMDGTGQAKTGGEESWEAENETGHTK